MKKILINDTVHQILIETLQQAGFECDQFPNLDKDGVIQIIDNYDGLIVRSKITIDSNFIDHAPHLKFIARVGAGMETIDVEYAEKRGITCYNSPEGNRDAVAEHALGMLLCLFNKIHTADLEIRNGFWKREENRGQEIKGKTIGIIGFGNMGSQFAKRLMGFDCQILAYDKYKRNYAPSYVREESLEQLYKESDIVSIHIPLNQETEYLVNEKFINQFHKPIYLINTARGKIVNTNDLVMGLMSGKIKGACLDVIEYENMALDAINTKSLPDSYAQLLNMKNVLLSPHVAGWTIESKTKLAYFLAKKIVEGYR